MGPTSEIDPWRRPGTVTAACVLTGVFASLAIAAGAVLLLMVTVGRDQFVDEWRDEPDLDALDVAPGTAASVIGVATAVCILLAMLAIVVAISAFRGSSAARVTLMVLSGLTAIGSLVLSLAVVPFLWVIASTTTLILLFTTSANRWYARAPQA